MTEPRHTADTINDDDLDKLYARAELAERRLHLAHQARRAKEQLLDDIRRALCDAEVIKDTDPYGHADLAMVIRQMPPGPEATQATESAECGHTMTGAFGRSVGPCVRPPGHAALFHRDASGTEWRTTSRTTPKEPTPMTTCTATIEGPNVPDDETLTCTVADVDRHPANHVGPKREYGRLLWTDHHAGATPHRQRGEEPTTHTSSAPAAHEAGPSARECTGDTS